MYWACYICLYIILIFKNCQCLNKPATAMVCTWNCQAARYWFAVFYKFTHAVLVKPITFVKPITPTCYTYTDGFLSYALHSIWVQFEWCRSWRDIGHHMPSYGQNVVFWGGGNLPLHLRFWKLCMKWLSNNDIYISLLEEAIGQFVPNFMSLN